MSPAISGSRFPRSKTFLSLGKGAIPPRRGQGPLMGMLDASWTRPLDERSSVTVTGGFGYGSTENEMKSSFSESGILYGDWNNHAFLGILGCAWNIRLSKEIMLTRMGARIHGCPSAGISGNGGEYTAVWEGALPQSGHDRRRFPATDNRVQRGPDVGQSSIGQLRARHLSPRCRNHGNRFGWRAAGSQPGRHAVRTGITSRLMITPAWEVNCSYRIEARCKTVNQTCSLGAGYSF